MEYPLLKLATVKCKVDNEYYRDEREYVTGFIGKTGVIVDYSDAHGLCYGMVFPVRDRVGSLQIHWFEPEEIEIEI